MVLRLLSDHTLISSQARAYYFLTIVLEESHDLADFMFLHLRTYSRPWQAALFHVNIPKLSECHHTNCTSRFDGHLALDIGRIGKLCRDSYKVSIGLQT